MTMSFNRRLVIALVSGFMLGALWLVAIRFVTFKDTRVHHHANFAVYVNGQKDEFSSSTFYEETSACSADEIGPRTRVHLHDQKPGVVHVHDEGATWGHLFANLGYTLGNDVIKTDEGVFIDAEGVGSLRFSLNGKEIDSLANETIQSEDAVVIMYESRAYQQQFANDLRVDPLGEAYRDLQKDAAEYNQKNDPSACTGTKPLTFGERLQKAIGIGE